MSQPNIGLRGTVTGWCNAQWNHSVNSITQC